VTTAGNPLTSFADDVAAAKRAIAAQDGPTVLVGHSYGGVVITEAGNDPKVVSLVYVAAFAPDAANRSARSVKPLRSRREPISCSATQRVPAPLTERHRRGFRPGLDAG